MTSTITEVGYVRSNDGGLDAGNEAVQADVDAIKAGSPHRRAHGARKVRRRSTTCRDAGCRSDHLLPVRQRPTTRHGRAGDPRDGGPVRPVSVVDRRVRRLRDDDVADRITPRPTDENLQAIANDLGVDDPAAAVKLELFIEWVIAGDLKADARSGRRAASSSSTTSPRTAAAQAVAAERVALVDGVRGDDPRSRDGLRRHQPP